MPLPDAELPEIKVANNGAVWLSLSPGQRKWVAFASVIRCILSHPLVRWLRRGERFPPRGWACYPWPPPSRTKRILRALGEGLGRAHTGCGKQAFART